MRIGEVAEEAGVNVQTLRYYERRGLLAAPRREASGYRRYDPAIVQRIRFIRRAQDLGFTLEGIRDLLALQTDRATSCAAVGRRASATLARIEDKMRALQRMRRALTAYVDACRDSTALEECPLLAALGGLEEEGG